MNTILKTIIINDIRQNILSLKLQVMFVVMLLVFVTGSVAYIYQYKASLEDHREYNSKSLEEMKKNAETNITKVAVTRRDYIFRPLQNGFIEDGKVQYTPNTINYNAYNVFNYWVSRSSGNPYLYLSQDLNWNFIITIILSFAVIILSFDSITGETEAHTMSLVLSNSVSRRMLILGKFLSIVLTSFLITLLGQIISLLILIFSGILTFNNVFLFETGAFLIVQLIFIACMAALGMFCSVVSRSSNIALLVGLTLWLIFLIFSPSLAVYSAEKLFAIKDSETIQHEMQASRDAINKAAPEGSWSFYSEKPFHPRHELRARNQTNLMNSDKKIMDAWFNEQFDQYRKAHAFTLFSPVSLMGSIGETVTGNGFKRFMKNWNDIHGYQVQFLNWFKEVDRNDPDSPHWYNPYEDCSTSRQKISVDLIPQFTETGMSISQRLSAALPGIILLIIYTAVLFGVTTGLFNRSDVR